MGSCYVLECRNNVLSHHIIYIISQTTKCIAGVLGSGRITNRISNGIKGNIFSEQLHATATFFLLKAFVLGYMTVYVIAAHSFEAIVVRDLQE